MTPFLEADLRRPSIAPVSPPLANPSTRPLRFLSTRSDGLCMRLNTILDAMILAQLFQADFGFEWSGDDAPSTDGQAIPEVHGVFERTFVDEHLQACVTDGSTLTRLTAPVKSELEFESLLASARRRGLFEVDQPRNLRHMLPFVRDRIAKDAYRCAFDALGFVDSIRRAIGLAREIDLAPDAVTLHVRGGDIVHGAHAHHGTYTAKAPSIFELERQLEASLSEKRQVWLIGQEADLIDNLSRRYPGVRELSGYPAVQSLDGAERVLFDALLMSRMSRIYGGNSGVTLLARRVGGVAFFNLSELDIDLDGRALLGDPLALAAYDGISSDMKAHSYLKLLHRVEPAGWNSTHLALLRLAKSWRTDCRFLEVLMICMSFHLGWRSEAEVRCRSFLQQILSPQCDLDVDYAFLLGGRQHCPSRELALLSGADRLGQPACWLLYLVGEAITTGTRESIASAVQAIDALRCGAGDEAIGGAMTQVLGRCLTDRGLTA